MDINRNGVVGRVFLVAHRLTRQFAGERDPDPPFQTNLCAFLRTILIWAPFAIAINLAVLAWAIFAFGYLGYMVWLNLSAFSMATAVGIAGAAAFIAVMVTIHGFLRFMRWAARAEIGREVGSLIATHYRAQKLRICPFIDIVETQP